MPGVKSKKSFYPEYNEASAIKNATIGDHSMSEIYALRNNMMDLKNRSIEE